MLHRLLMAMALSAAIAAHGAAQSTTAPTTGPQRRAVVIPPGFRSITVGHRTALAEPADEAWVRQTLTDIEPVTMPSTMPSDILDRITANRAALKARMLADLALADPAVVETFLSQKLEPALHRLDQVRAPLFYMVTTRQRLKELLKGGWSDPHLYYNRVADDVQFDPRFALAADSQTDDLLVPVVHQPDATPEQKQKLLSDAVQSTERSVTQSISARSMSGAQQAFMDFMVGEVFGPLELKADREWFSVGTTGVLSAWYAAICTGVSEEIVLANMTREDRRNPIRPAAIDLLHPTPISQMRQSAILAYVDAYRRKAVRAVVSLINRGGNEAIPKALTAIRKTPPADGPALLRLIADSTGVDLSSEVGPQP